MGRKWKSYLSAKWFRRLLWYTNLKNRKVVLFDSEHAGTGGCRHPMRRTNTTPRPCNAKKIADGIDLCGEHVRIITYCATTRRREMMMQNAKDGSGGSKCIAQSPREPWYALQDMPGATTTTPNLQDKVDDDDDDDSNASSSSSQEKQQDVKDNVTQCKPTLPRRKPIVITTSTPVYPQRAPPTYLESMTFSYLLTSACRRVACYKNGSPQPDKLERCKVNRVGSILMSTYPDMWKYRRPFHYVSNINMYCRKLFANVADAIELHDHPEKDKPSKYAWWSAWTEADENTLDTLYSATYDPHGLFLK